MDSFDDVILETQTLRVSGNLPSGTLQEYAARVERTLVELHKEVRRLSDDGKSDLLPWSITDKNGNLYNESNRAAVLANIQAIPSAVSPPRTHRRVKTVLPEIVRLAEIAFDLQKDIKDEKSKALFAEELQCPDPAAHERLDTTEKDLIQHIFKLTEALAEKDSLQRNVTTHQQTIQELKREVENLQKELDEGGCPNPLAHSDVEKLENFLIDHGFEEGPEGWEAVKTRPASPEST